MTQNQRLLDWLKQWKTITPMEAWQELGIYRLGARAWDLKQAGHPIKSKLVKVQNRWGETIKVAQYWMEEA
jgi:hypothetical protein